jgi:hypothetical protein
MPSWSELPSRFPIDCCLSAMDYAATSASRLAGYRFAFFPARFEWTLNAVMPNWRLMARKPKPWFFNAMTS